MRLMYVTQHMYDALKYPFGGLEIHVKDLIENLPEMYEIYVFSPSYRRKHYIVTVYQAGRKKSLQKWKYGEKIAMHMLNTVRYAELFRDVLRYNKIEGVHIHNCIEHTFDISRVCYEEGIGVIKGEHDYYDIAGENFQKDFRNRFSKHTAYEKKWVEQTDVFYRKLDAAICYSDKSIEHFKKFFPETRYIKILHGIHEEKNRQPYFLEKHDKLTFVFCGRIAVEKGAVELFQAMLTVDESLYEFHIFGMWEPNMLVWQKKIMGKKNIHIYGRYDSKVLFNKTFKKLKPQYALIVSDWDETFNYVLSEMMQAGILPIATAKGAMKERIEESGFGVLIQDNSVERIVGAIESIITLDLKEVSESYQHMQLPGVNDMIEEYVALYLSFDHKNEYPVASQKPLFLASKIYVIMQAILLPIAFSKLWVSTKSLRDRIRKK